MEDKVHQWICQLPPPIQKTCPQLGLSSLTEPFPFFQIIDPVFLNWNIYWGIFTVMCHHLITSCIQGWRMQFLWRQRLSVFDCLIELGYPFNTYIWFGFTFNWDCITQIMGSLIDQQALFIPFILPSIFSSLLMAYSDTSLSNFLWLFQNMPWINLARSSKTQLPQILSVEGKFGIC